MRNIIRIGAGTDGRNRFVAIALGVALAAGPAVALPAAALAAPATDAAAASTTAGTTITLQGADGASLAGHTFDVYRIGTYTDQILNGTRISSLGVRGDTASNAWAADAIGIANAYDPSTADDIGKVYGYDDAGNIANIKMDSQTRQLRNISKALAQSSKKPAAIQGGANLTTTQSTLTINVPSEGLYYITDSAGNPIMVGTKSGNANIMKNDAKDPQWRTLGTAVVKAKSVRVDKKVQVQRNGTTVGKDGTTNDPVSVTVGDTVTNTVEVTVPNKQAASAVKFKLIDQPKGQTYVQGSLSVRLKNAPQTDITADAGRAATPARIPTMSWYNLLYKQEVRDDTGRGLQQFQGESQDLYAQGQRGRRHPSRDQRGPGGQRGRDERRRLRFAHGDAARLPEPVSER